MTEPSTSLALLVASLWGHRSLVIALARREIVGRYQGSLLGRFWSFFVPLMMLGVYTFVFSVVFQARWPASSGSRTEFALILFAGLTIFNVFAESVARAPSLIIGNPNFVKKVIFPLEILPFVSLLTSLFHGAINLAVWALFFLILKGIPPLTIMWLPLIILPLAALTLGTTYLFASVGVYFRDIGQIIGVAITAGMFLTPIFYAASALPDLYQTIIWLNPLTYYVEQGRNLLIFGLAPAWGASLIAYVFALIILWLGFATFQKLRRGFADVL
ncbi:MAG: ABC transporter permease [Beijerinckiaceae bacterium]|nr:ABC transporter permease [Beijerinckiaceae bacterium]